MTIIAIIGDDTTTTAVALASAWPTDDDVVLVESDRSGGSLSAWLDTPVSPSLSTLVAQSHQLKAAPGHAWETISKMVKRSDSGIEFIATPTRSREAARAIDEASSTVFPALADLDRPLFIVDCGRHLAPDRLPAAVAAAGTVVVVHHQSSASARASAVRLERLAETVISLVALMVPVRVAVVGERPFQVDEVERFLLDETAEHRALQLHVHPLSDDPLSAAVIAGRQGVSAKRVQRLPLARSAANLVEHLRNDPSLVAHHLTDHVPPDQVPPAHVGDVSIGSASEDLQ